MDGYATADIAAGDLANYYGSVSVHERMQRIATLPETLWLTLSQEEQAQIIALGLDAAVRIPVFRRIFLPSLLFWFSTYGNATVDKRRSRILARPFINQWFCAKQFP